MPTSFSDAFQSIEPPKEQQPPSSMAGAWDALEPQQAAPIQQTPPEIEEGLGQQALIALGAGMTSTFQEAKKLGLKAMEGLGQVEAGTTQAYSDQINAEREEFAQTPIGQSTQGKIFQTIGEVVPTFVVPGGITGSLARRMSLGALAGGASGFLAPTSSRDVFNAERVNNLLVGTVLGGALPGVAAAARGGYRSAKEFAQGFTKAGAKKAVTDFVSQADVAVPTGAARRLGTFLTPGEASKLDDVIAQEKTIQLTREGLSDLAVRLRGREGTLNTRIMEFVEDIAPDDPKRAMLISQGYDTLASTRMAPKFFQKIADDPILGPEWQRFVRDPSYRPDIASFADDSAARVDVFRNFLYEKAERLSKAGKGRAARNLTDARTELTDTLDLLLPDFAVARREASLNITQRNMLSRLSKVKGTRAFDPDGTPITTPTDFYRTFLKDDKSFNDLLFNLRDMPDAIQKATDLRLVLSHTENSPLSSLFRVGDPLHSAPTFGFGAKGVAASKGLAALNKRYNEALVEFITNPNYTSELLATPAALASRREAPATTAKAIDGLNTVLARIAAQQSTGGE